MGRKKGRKIDHRLVSYLANNFKGEQHDPKSTLLSYLRKFDAIKIGDWSIEFRERELNSLYRLEELHKLLPLLEDELRSQKIYIMVDELDRGWDGSEDAKLFVSGLFQASIEINKLSKNLRVLISLRTELYDNIPEIYEDAQKMRDLVRHVNWDERSLRNLIEKRFNGALMGYGSDRSDGWWYSIFEEGLSYRKTDSYKYIIDRTTFRPREIIEFCSECIKSHTDGAMKINYQSISQAERLYSKSRMDDIAKEFRFNYPGLKNVFESFRGKVFNFTKSEMESQCAEIILSASKLGDAAQWLENQDESYLLRVLWVTGFLRAYVVGNQKGTEASGSQYVGVHQISDLTLESVARFQVHPMFRTHLGMREKG